jgi:hypothetical protein
MCTGTESCERDERDDIPQRADASRTLSQRLTPHLIDEGAVYRELATRGCILEIVRKPERREQRRAQRPHE